MNTSVIICCAGMGSRLGIGTTKALVDVCGKPLILRQLELLKDYDDIRIVVGFQAERLINVVKAYRSDVMFAFNYDYEHTGVADSLRKALVGSRENIISLDGDTLINSADFDHFLSSEGDCIAVSALTSTEPIRANVENGVAVRLSKTEGSYQWSGIAKYRRDKFAGTSKHVYDVINEMLPLPIVEIRSREINTPDDYDAAIAWFENGCED